jgi:hypothetical protein
MENPIAVGFVRRYPRVKPPVNRDERPEIDLDHPSNGGHLSRDFLVQEIGSRELRSSGDERSGHSMVETPK